MPVRVKSQPQAVKEAWGANERKLLKALSWDIRRNPEQWSARQNNAMHWLQRSTLKSAWAWRLKMALRGLYAKAAASKDSWCDRDDLKSCNNWAMHSSRLEPFEKLAKTSDAVVRGMLQP